MIGDNIRSIRMMRGITQEEMARKLHVVRQTVSKWEKGLSVPDADILLQMAELLQVPVTRLLGIGPQEDVGELTQQAALLKEKLASLSAKEVLRKEAGRKRGLILLLSFASMLASLVLRSKAAAIGALGGCALVSLVILYRNMPLLAAIPPDDAGNRPLKAATIFDLILIGAAAAAALWLQSNEASLSEGREKLLALGIVEAFLLFSGYISPKLPFNQHTGLRLPWTIQDEDTWNIAHKLLRWTALPLAIAYPAAAFIFSSFEAVSLTAIALLVGIPGILSFVFFWKKTHGKL